MFDRLEQTVERYEELQRQMLDPAVVANPARYSALAREHGGLEKTVQKYRQFKRAEEQIGQTERFLKEEADPTLRDYARSELEDLKSQHSRLLHELEDLMSADGVELRADSLIMEIRAGTGGDEAALFARDLFQMYQHLADRRGWKVEMIEAHPTNLGGFREVILGISGPEVYRTLQFESGGHRVQRIPETESKGRRHTSAATVAVLPEPSEVEIDVKDEDLRVDTFRASGPGGQHVNKTSSAVRITHIPTGLVVQCQDEKSQHKNRAKALRVLRSRLYDMKLEEERRRRAEQRRTLIGSGDRSQRIRTYNFPENRVTDHRIGLTLYKLDSVMAGDMDELLEALQEFDRQQRLQGDGGSGSSAA